MRERGRGIVWAVQAASGVARHITEVKTGLACGCVCPGCEMPLEAVNAENPQWRRRPHFRHEKSPELPTCLRSAVLTGARALLAAATEFLVPTLTVAAQVRAPDGKVFEETEVVPERRVGITRLSFQDETDAVLLLEDGREVRVRLVASARATEDSQDAPLADIIIDVSDPDLQSADPEMLRRRITLGGDAARHRWCRQNYPDLVMKAQAKAQGKADAYWAVVRKREEMAAAQPKPVPAAPQSIVRAREYGGSAGAFMTTPQLPVRSLTWRASLPDAGALATAANALSMRTGVAASAVLDACGKVRGRGDLNRMTPGGTVIEWARELGVPEHEMARFLEEAGYAMVM